MRRKFQRVEAVHGTRVGDHIGARRRHRARVDPRVVGVRVQQRRAVVAGGYARCRASGGLGDEVVGAGGKNVRAAVGFLAAQLHADRIGVLHAGCGEFAAQAGGVGQRIGIGDARIGAAPDGAVQHGVALGVVGLGPHVIVAGLAVARDIAQHQLVAEIVAHVDGADIALRVAEIAVHQAVEGCTRHIDRGAIAVLCHVDA